jgi:HK97 family phage major capsid protein
LIEGISKGALEGMINGKSRSAAFEIKAGDMTVANNFTGEVIPAQYVAGIKYDPTRAVHVRQLLPQGSTQSEVVRFVRESAYDNGAAPIAQGGLYPESDFDLTAEDANVRKIGTYFRISEEMLADTAQLTSYLSARAPEKLLTVEDTQLLYGNGSGQNIEGVSYASTAFAAGSFADTITAANQFDVLTVAINQIAIADQPEPTAILCHPTDIAKLLVIKVSATDKRYVDRLQMIAGQLSLDGIPIIKTTLVTAAAA